MKVALEAGEVLDVAILDGDKVVGHLSLQLKSVSGSTRTVGRPAAAKAVSADDSAASGRRKPRKPRKPLSDETKARMAEAQRRRWEANRQPEEPTNS